MQPVIQIKCAKLQLRVAHLSLPTHHGDFFSQDIAFKPWSRRKIVQPGRVRFAQYLAQRIPRNRALWTAKNHFGQSAAHRDTYQLLVCSPGKYREAEKKPL